MLRLKLFSATAATASTSQLEQAQSQEGVRAKWKTKEGQLANGVTVQCSAARPAYQAPPFSPCIKPQTEARSSKEVCFIPCEPLPACYQNAPGNGVYTAHQLELMQQLKKSKAVENILAVKLLNGLGPSIGEKTSELMHVKGRGPRENAENVCCILLPYVPYIKACYEHSPQAFKTCQEKMKALVEDYYGQVGDRRLHEKARRGRLAHFDDH